MSFNRQNNNAFTLVELAIVIVIIGLLVSGVLGGQELVRITRLNTMITDMKAIQAGAILYKDKFRKLPGDDNSALSKFPNCNDNRRCIDGDNSQRILDLPSETPFAHMVSANLIKNKPCNLTAFAVADAYGTSIDGLCLLLAGPITTRVWGQQAGTYIRINSSSNSMLSATDAKYLDDKLDDGIASSGLFYTIGSGSQSVATCVDNNNYGTLQAGEANYNLSSEAKLCVTHYKFNL